MKIFMTQIYNFVFKKQKARQLRRAYPLKLETFES